MGPVPATVRFITEYSGLGGSSRMIVHLAGLLAERYDVGIDIHCREHGDPFLNNFFEFRFGRLLQRDASLYRLQTFESTEEAIASLGGAGPVIAHLPFCDRMEILPRLQEAAGRVLLWNLEVPGHYSYHGTVPAGTTVVYVSEAQAADISSGNGVDLFRIPAPFEEIRRLPHDPRRHRFGTVGMVSTWTPEKGVLESLAGFRRSGAGRLRIWTRTKFRRRIKLFMQDRRIRLHRPTLDLSEIYSGFDCLLHMQPHSMGESNVIRDCLSIGTPCVLSDIEGHRRYGSIPGVTLVDRDNASKVGEAIDAALQGERRTRPVTARRYRPMLPDNEVNLGRWADLLGIAEHDSGTFHQVGSNRP